jgi:ComF family protein
MLAAMADLKAGGGSARAVQRPFALGLAALRRLLAPRCVVCDLDDGDPLCDGCARDYFSADAQRCASCALRLPPSALAGDRCGRCLREPPHFDASFALADYAPPLDRMIAALKFGGRLPLADAFGTLLTRAAQPLLREADAICPVPLAFERHAERGFNQAHEIARRLAAACGKPLRADILLRTRHTAAQMDLALAERRRNVRGAFVARGELAKMSIVVIDDVMTTGATLDEIAAALKRAGAARVTNLVVARTP